MQALCERLNGLEGVRIHVAVSTTASNQIGMERAAHVHALIRRFPKIEFIAGTDGDRSVKQRVPTRRPARANISR